MGACIGALDMMGQAPTEITRDHCFFFPAAALAFCRNMHSGIVNSESKPNAA